MFAHRDFSDGVLGLAWVSSPGNNAGICADGFNTAWVTTLNFDSVVPLAVTQVTLAHEVGHNAGSPHDSTAACSPGGNGGNFIMHDARPCAMNSSANPGFCHPGQHAAWCSVFDMLVRSRSAM
jgi:disintegrin and metalloproteinase domain-containing protein 10